MTATIRQIEQLRRMTGEITSDNYTDGELMSVLETYPLMDANGEQPYTWSSDTPPVKEANNAWIPTYDMHAAAADIWEEKAAVVAGNYDFNADGGNYSRSQAYEHMMAQTRYHRSRRSARTMTARKWPEETASSKFPWIGNLPERDR